MGKELMPGGGLTIAAEDAFGVLKEYFSRHKNMGGRIDDRIRII